MSMKCYMPNVPHIKNLINLSLCPVLMTLSRYRHPRSSSLSLSVAFVHLFWQLSDLKHSQRIEQGSCAAQYLHLAEEQPWTPHRIGLKISGGAICVPGVTVVGKNILFGLSSIHPKLVGFCLSCIKL